MEWRHEFRTADTLESWVGIGGTAFLHSRSTLLGRHGMTRNRGVALPDDPRPSEDRTDPAHLRITQPMDLLELEQQPLVLFAECGLRLCKSAPQQTLKHENRQSPSRHHGEPLRVR